MDWQTQRDVAAVRRAIKFTHWDMLAGMIAERRRLDQPHLAPTGTTDWTKELQELRDNGIVKLPMRVDAQPFRQYLDGQTTHVGPHVYSADKNYRGYRPDTVLRAPGLVDLFNNERIISLIEQYLECVPTLYSVNAWWSDIPTEHEPNLLQIFHRDIDDWRFVVLFLYLTHVDEESGAHQVILGSHKQQDDGLGLDFSEAMEEKYRANIFSATGPAGTLWLVNTLALHRGLIPKKAPRLMAWARYGLMAGNQNHMGLEQGPLARRQIPSNLEDTPRNRYINRLLFEFDRGSY